MVFISHTTTGSFMSPKLLHLLLVYIVLYKVAPLIHHLQQSTHLHQFIINAPCMGSGTAPFFPYNGHTEIIPIAFSRMF
jgi:hypothetical protein